jgi:hypothetical protein
MTELRYAQTRTGEAMLRENKTAIINAVKTTCAAEDNAMSTDAIWKEVRKTRRISKETLLCGLRELLAEGVVHNWSYANRFLWWPDGMNPVLPQRIETRIINALKDIMARTGNPATIMDISRASGIDDNTVRYYLRYGRCEGVREIQVGTKKSVFVCDDSARVAVKPQLDPVKRAEIAQAILCTAVGDDVQADFLRPRDGNKRMAHMRRTLRVTHKTARLCIFDSGDSVRWSDMVLYYRNGKKKPLEMTSRIGGRI